MPRPISWLPRLHDIRRSVSNSVRSHYGRADLEQLFELQPRAAQKLLGMLPTTLVGTSHLVEREALAEFLERVHAADDISAVIRRQREELPKTSRKKLRTLVRTDQLPVTLASLPPGLSLAQGRLEVRFHTVEELAQVLFGVAQILAGELEEFARQYELYEKRPVDPEAEEIAKLLAEGT